jgi:hypothetical protein
MRDWDNLWTPLRRPLRRSRRPLRAGPGRGLPGGASAVPVLALACALLAGCGPLLELPDPGPGPAPGSGACPATAGQRALVALNHARLSAGLPPLAVDARLVAAAEAHSGDMAERRTLDHTGADGSTVGQRAARAGYAWSWVAENVARGHATPEEAVASWLASPPHRANLLSVRAAHVGIGLAGGAGGPYWTGVFGETRAGTRVPPGGCHP